MDYIYKDDVWYLHKDTKKINLATIADTKWGKLSDGKFYYAGFSSENGISIGEVYSNVFEYSSTAWAGSGKFGITSSGNLWIDTGDTSVTTVELLQSWLTNHSAILYGGMTESEEIEIEDESLIDSLNEVSTLHFSGSGSVNIITSANTIANITIGYYSYDINNQYDKYVYMIDTANWEKIG